MYKNLIEKANELKGNFESSNLFVSWRNQFIVKEMEHYKRALIFTLLLSFPALLLATSIVTRFVAIPDNDRIYVRWTSQSEAQLIRYELYRQQENALPMLLTSLSPNGDNQNYEYVDMNVGARSKDGGSPANSLPLSQQRYTYILKMITTSGTLEMQASVSYQTSTTRKTWGSIKALFR